MSAVNDKGNRARRPAAALSPSLMCADLFGLRGILRTFELRGIEYLHMDVMDGVFVPNFCLGTDFCRRVKAECSVPLDVHLMITEPEKKLDAFPFGPGDAVSVHYESTADVGDALGQIRSRGAKAFLALNPDTPVGTAEAYLGLIDGVLLMTVYPGFAGQKMVPGSLERIASLRDLLDRKGLEDMPIEVDGCVSFENAPRMHQAGADIFVSGSSGVFRAGGLDENITALRELLGGQS